MANPLATDPERRRLLVESQEQYNQLRLQQKTPASLPRLLKVGRRNTYSVVDARNTKYRTGYVPNLASPLPRAFVKGRLAGLSRLPLPGSKSGPAQSVGKSPLGALAKLAREKDGSSVEKGARQKSTGAAVRLLGTEKGGDSLTKVVQKANPAQINLTSQSKLTGMAKLSGTSKLPSTSKLPGPSKLPDLKAPEVKEKHTWPPKRAESTTAQKQVKKADLPTRSSSVKTAVKIWQAQDDSSEKSKTAKEPSRLWPLAPNRRLQISKPIEEAKLATKSALATPKPRPVTSQSDVSAGQVVETPPVVETSPLADVTIELAVEEPVSEPSVLESVAAVLKPNLLERVSHFSASPSKTLAALDQLVGIRRLLFVPASESAIIEEEEPEATPPQGSSSEAPPEHGDPIPVLHGSELTSHSSSAGSSVFDRPPKTRLKRHTERIQDIAGLSLASRFQEIPNPKSQPSAFTKFFRRVRGKSAKPEEEPQQEDSSDSHLAFDTPPGTQAVTCAICPRLDLSPISDFGTHNDNTGHTLARDLEPLVSVTALLTFDAAALKEQVESEVIRGRLVDSVLQQKVGHPPRVTHSLPELQRPQLNKTGVLPLAGGTERAQSHVPSLQNSPCLTYTSDVDCYIRRSNIDPLSASKTPESFSQFAYQVLE